MIFLLHFTKVPIYIISERKKKKRLAWPVYLEIIPILLLNVATSNTMGYTDERRCGRDGTASGQTSAGRDARVG